MIEPSFDKLLERVDSKYTLVVAAAKRARQLMNGAAPKTGETKSRKPVTIALQEIAEGKLRYERKRSGIK